MKKPICSCHTFNYQDKIKVKKIISDARLPEKSYSTDAGFDIFSIDNGNSVYENGILKYIEYRTGIAIEPPFGYSVEIYPRSSISKYDLELANSIGLIDNSFRGEIKLRFNLKPHKLRFYTAINNDRLRDKFKLYQKGDKIGQLVVRKDIMNFEMIEVDVLNETKRGSGGFGSSGK